MKVLVLNLKSEYFDDIKSGKKFFEYRLKNEYWSKRLLNKSYDLVSFRKGYPKNTDIDKIITVPYKGYEIKSIVHPHFGHNLVEVFAIYI